MRGVCDTCEQASEVFRAPGRNHLLCSECYINIGTVVQLYEMLSEIERDGSHDFDLEARLKVALGTLFNRVPPAAKQATLSIQ